MVIFALRLCIQESKNLVSSIYFGLMTIFAPVAKLDNCVNMVTLIAIALDMIGSLY